MINQASLSGEQTCEISLFNRLQHQARIRPQNVTKLSSSITYSSNKSDHVIVLVQHLPF